jgi:hypothetical protein
MFTDRWGVSFYTEVEMNGLQSRVNILEAENTALREKIEELKACTISHDEWYAQCNKIVVLEAENAELRKDAARYQHMRNNAAFLDRNGPGLYWYLPRHLSGGNGEQLDASIDAAMGEHDEPR